MKISKRQLRRLIKEEKRKLLSEYQAPADKAKAAAKVIHQRLDEIITDVLDGLSPNELEVLRYMELTGPGGLDEPTQTLARIALSQLDDGGHYRGS